MSSLCQFLNLALRLDGLLVCDTERAYYKLINELINKGKIWETERAS